MTESSQHLHHHQCHIAPCQGRFLFCSEELAPADGVARFYVEANGPSLRVRIFYLARHASHGEVGHILSGRSEIGLSDAGRGEAARLSDRLSGVPLAAIHASPRRRAAETARIVAAPHRLDVTEVAALDEIDFGAWSGRSFASLQDDPAWRRWNASRDDAATPAGETMAQAVSRAADHLAAIEEAGPVLCVTHGDIIRGLVARALGLDMAGIFRFECDPASLTTLALQDGATRLVSLNERPQ